jgi:hypothetical protein
MEERRGARSRSTCARHPQALASSPRLAASVRQPPLCGACTWSCTGGKPGRHPFARTHSRGGTPGSRRRRPPSPKIWHACPLPCLPDFCGTDHPQNQKSKSGLSSARSTHELRCISGGHSPRHPRRHPWRTPQQQQTSSQLTESRPGSVHRDQHRRIPRRNPPGEEGFQQRTREWTGTSSSSAPPDLSSTSPVPLNQATKNSPSTDSTAKSQPGSVTWNIPSSLDLDQRERESEERKGRGAGPSPLELTTVKERPTSTLAMNLNVLALASG